MTQHSSRVFRIKEQLRHIHRAAKAFVLLRTSRKTKLMNKALKERIMLAVTQVNGCAMCSFVHSRIALDSGMDREQIKELLAGDFSNVPTDEAVAVLFGQHFADSRETPSEEATRRLVREYGFQKAELIIAACNMITMTNGMGTSMDYLYQRLRFRRNHASNLLLEVFNPALTMLLFPVLTIWFRIAKIFTDVHLLQPRFELAND